MVPHIAFYLIHGIASVRPATEALLDDKWLTHFRWRWNLMTYEDKGRGDGRNHCNEDACAEKCVRIS